MPLDLFCALPHAIFSVTDDYVREEDSILASLGRARRVAVSVPAFFGVARIVAQTDLIGVLPGRFAFQVVPRLGLGSYRLPFDMALTEMWLYWHRRETASREHGWLRAMILDELAPIDETRHPIGAGEFRSAAG
jgi:DNA-binding transcriptional LysR family regulator